MPLLSTVLLALITACVVIGAAAWRPRLRKRLASRAFAALLPGAAAAASALSALVAQSRSSGVGTLTERGWPKPFYFRWVGWETGEAAGGVNALYFAGNTLVWASVFAALVAAQALAGEAGDPRPAASRE